MAQQRGACETVLESGTGVPPVITRKMRVPRSLGIWAFTCEILKAETPCRIMSQQKESGLAALATRFLKLGWIPDIKWLRRTIVGIIGFTVLLVGIAMIVLPGP